MAARILVVDNYDSFVFNLVQYLQQLGAQTDVVRNDDVTIADALAYDGCCSPLGRETQRRQGLHRHREVCWRHGPDLWVCLGTRQSLKPLERP